MTRAHMSYPSTTAFSSRRPETAFRSPIASAAGTIPQPGCVPDGACESSVSSECARNPLVMAAVTAVVRNGVESTCASSVPPWLRANSMAMRPGSSAAPETIAASVSRMWCLPLTATSGGNAASRACTMYRARVSISSAIGFLLAERFRRSISRGHPSVNARPP